MIEFNFQLNYFDEVDDDVVVLVLVFLKTIIEFTVNPHEGLRRHPFTCPCAAVLVWGK